MNAITAILSNFADHSIRSAASQTRFEALQPTPHAADINDLGRFLSC